MDSCAHRDNTDNIKAGRAHTTQAQAVCKHQKRVVISQHVYQITRREPTCSGEYAV
jgi:hypothetical protein